MKKNLICLTIDTDPDGFSGPAVNRHSLQFNALDMMRDFSQLLLASDYLKDWHVPVTWFVRADDQIQCAFGDPMYLFHRFEDMFVQAVEHGHELGWHPHLYSIHHDKPSVVEIADEIAACEQIGRIWQHVQKGPEPIVCFRNGEGWHTALTLNFLEEIGILYDSTAIPGRRRDDGHPLDWERCANHPWFPDPADIQKSIRTRSILELPMNTWLVNAPYDTRPKLRYMAPSVHQHIFAQSLANWNSNAQSDSDLNVWILICHPDELVPLTGPDRLFSGSTDSLFRNLSMLARCIQNQGDQVEFVSLRTAGEQWKSLMEGSL
jgi:hypothetical protein